MQLFEKQLGEELVGADEIHFTEKLSNASPVIK
jgi:hypothetical protein